MGSEDNANLIRRGYAAFSTGDAANIFHVRDGCVSEVWELHDDPARNAWLWA
jgi:ketosteroid isomerase-like protein